MPLKFFIWNVNGLRSILKKKVLDDLTLEQFVQDYDIVALQETKVPDNFSFDSLFCSFKYRFSVQGPKSRAGIVIFSKIKPISVKLDPVDSINFGGRCITLEFKDFYFISVYQPNSGQNLKTLEYRNKWDYLFKKYLRTLNKKVIITGDFNVIENPQGIYNFEKTHNKLAGVTDIEMNNFKTLLREIKVKVISDKNQGFTYYSYRTNGRKYNHGMKIDFTVCSNELKIKTKVLDKITGSDHIPLSSTLT